MRQPIQRQLPELYLRLRTSIPQQLVLWIKERVEFAQVNIAALNTNNRPRSNLRHRVPYRNLPAINGAGFIGSFSNMFGRTAVHAC